MTEQERGELVIKIAVRLMRAGRARGWSDAIRQAEAQMKEREHGPRCAVCQDRSGSCHGD